MPPIPDRMKHLKIDARGYPIPWGVFVDPNGTPHFAINDEASRVSMIRGNLCSICGKLNTRGRWFVGGCLSAFHQYGAFIDPPMHFECAHYALQVCPYLAAPRFSKEVGMAKLEAQKERSAAMILIDNTMIPGRPEADVFAAVMAVKMVVFENLNTKPIQPYSTVEFWRHGKRIPDDEGYRITAQAIAKTDEKGIPEQIERTPVFLPAKQGT